MFSILSTSVFLLEESKYSLTNMKLNKILFYVYGYCLFDDYQKKYCNRFDEKPQAWMFGPVFPTVYHKFKVFGASVIEERPLHKYYKTTDNPINEIKTIYGILKDYRESQLIAMSHKKDGAWFKNYRSNRQNIVISDEDIIEEFKKYIVNG